jgi:hypothetical protein
MIEHSTVIPWGVKEEVTLKCLQDAGDVVLTELRALFPEAEGFQFKVYKKGKDIQVRRGWTWGLYVGIKDTKKGLKLRVWRNSKLTMFLAILAFSIVVILDGMWVLKYTNPFRSGFLEFFFTWAVGSLFSGLPAMQLVYWTTQPWLSMPSSAVVKLTDALKEEVAEKVNLGNGVPYPQQNEPS